MINFRLMMRRTNTNWSINVEYGKQKARDFGFLNQNRILWQGPTVNGKRRNSKVGLFQSSSKNYCIVGKIPGNLKWPIGDYSFGDGTIYVLRKID